MKRVFRKIDRGSIVLLCLSLAFCFLGGEAISRLLIFGPKGLSYEAMRTADHVGRSGLLQASAHLDILWELRPNLSTQFKFHPFFTNSDGLRDREYSHNKPEKTFRVAVLGDSYTMGEGVSVEEIYHSVLEEKFNAVAKDSHFEFINFGVAGYSLPQYVATIRYKVAQFAPDLILIGFCAANDSEPPNFEAFKSPYKVLPPGTGFWRSYMFARVGDIYKRYYNILRHRQHGYNADLAFVDEQFKKLADLSHELKIPLLIAYIDNRAASSDLAPVQAAAAKYGFDFIDATGGFPEDRSTDHIIFLTDNHPNAVANRIMADSLFEQLATRDEFRSRIRAD